MVKAKRIINHQLRLRPCC